MSTDLEPDRFVAWNRVLHAFVTTEDDAAGAACGGTGPLAGIPFGVKDIIDVAGVPTRNGSRAFVDAPPPTCDAEVVRSLKEAGARFTGKTTTTEFAFTDPTTCRNPHDLSRSPGGSSSGSGAAVGAGMVDVALGTQTAGSLCRPAAYCGAVGLKPSFGWASTKGVAPLAPSFDTVGIIARSVDLAQRTFEAITGAAVSGGAASETGHLCTGVFGGGITPDTDTHAALRDAARCLDMSEPIQALPTDADAVVKDHRTVMFFEAHEAHGHLLQDHRKALLQPNFRAALEEGGGLSDQQVNDARDRLERARATFWASLSNIAAVLSLPVPEGAPLTGSTTGFQHWLTPWTVFGGPLIVLPWGADCLGRPLSVMLAGHPGRDADLLALAACLERDAPPLPLPILPRS